MEKLVLDSEINEAIEKLRVFYPVKDTTLGRWVNVLIEAVHKLQHERSDLRGMVDGVVGQLRHMTELKQSYQTEAATLREALESSLAMMRHAHDRLPNDPQYETLRLSLIGECGNAKAAITPRKAE